MSTTILCICGQWKGSVSLTLKGGYFLNEGGRSSYFNSQNIRHRRGSANSTSWKGCEKMTFILIGWCLLNLHNDGFWYKTFCSMRVTFPYTCIALWPLYLVFEIPQWSYTQGMAHWCINLNRISAKSGDSYID